MMTIEQLLEHEHIHLDEAQKRAVKARGNTVVGAGAGSGKTTVLSYRFLRLMLDGIDCDRILALTFTQKAAREMKSRIGGLLESIAKADDIDAETHDYFAMQLKEHFPLSTISTLDSFCSSILRSDSLRYGLTADFTIDETTFEKRSRSIARKLLWNVKSDRGARVLAIEYKADDLMNMLTTLAKKEYHLPVAFPPDVVKQFLDTCHAKCEAAKQWIITFLEHGNEYSDQGVSEKALENKALLAAWLVRLENGEWPAFLAETITIRKPGKVKEGSYAAFMKENLDDFKQNRLVASDAFAVAGHEADLYAVIDFLQRYAEACAREKRSTGVLCFNDVSNLAVDVLRTNVTLRRSTANKFQAIMVDEFQDNNSLQRNLVFLLAAKPSFDKLEIPGVEDIDGDKLFFVGDEKQSIYRFRGADVSVFKALSHEFPSQEPIHMETNYRTEKFLIDRFSQIFSSLMGDAKEAYEAQFQQLGTPEGKEPAPSSMTVLVKTFVDKQDVDEHMFAAGAECEAYAVAQMIDRMLKSDDYLVKEKSGNLRRPVPSDIAILMRKCRRQMVFEKALKRFNIPYDISSFSRSLMLEAPANDIYSLLQVCIHPEDKLAYLAVLRSPFCDLSDEDAATIVTSDLPPFDPAATSLDSYRRCCSFFAELKAATSDHTLTSLLQFIWMEGGYRFAFLTRPGFQVYLEHFATLYHMAESVQAEGESLPAFLSIIRPYLSTSEKITEMDEEILQEKRNGVHIMTIHASKGLEFPIVFVVDLGNSRSPNDTSLLSFDGMSIPSFCDGDVREIFATEDTRKAEEEAEAKRLLYVALTRAKQHLVLSGTTNGKECQLVQCMGPLGIPFGDRMMDGTTPDGVAYHLIEDMKRSNLYGDRSFSPATDEAIDAWYGVPSVPCDFTSRRIAVTSFAPEAMHTASAVDMTTLPSDGLLEEKGLTAAWGTLVHAIVMRDMGCLNVNMSDQALLPDELKELPIKERNLLMREADNLSHAFLQSAFYQREVKPYPCKAEVKFFSRETREDGPLVVEGSIDVLVDRGESMDILDFKTDQKKEPSVHRGQVTVYKEAVERITKKKVRCAIVYLRSPEEVEWWN